MGGQSKEGRSCTDVKQNNLLCYSSQEFVRSGETQMWKITFQMHQKEKKKLSKPLQQLCDGCVESFVWLIEFLMTQ